MLCQKRERRNPISGALLRSSRSQSSCRTFKGEGSGFPARDRSRVLTTTSSDVEVRIRHFHYFGQAATHAMLIFSLGLQLLAFPCCNTAV